MDAVYDVNGNNNNNGWGNGWGGLIGGAIGGAFGSGWGNNNRNNNGNCCGDQFIMDSITSMRSDLNSIGRDQLMQSAAGQSAMCQGFGGVNATVERVGAAQALGQARTEAAVLTVGYQGQLAAKDNTFAIVSSQKDCCCATQRLVEREGCETRGAIHAEGEATRALIAQNAKEQLLRELAAKDAKIAALESQQFQTGLSLAAQNTLLQHIRSFIPATTTPTTPAA